MNKKVLKKRQLLFICFCFLFAACKDQPEVYLEAYIETEADVQDVKVSDASEVIVTDIDRVKIGEVDETVTEEEKLVYVYVCGAVMIPNVYSLPEGSRICDAITMAGGLREDADAMSVNQAQLVSDGQMLRIYTKEETAEAGLSETYSLNEEFAEAGTEDRININTATRSQLMTLPGIGSAKADAILAYRTEQGAFHSIEDLMKIPGIKEGVFEQIRERIRID